MKTASIHAAATVLAAGLFGAAALAAPPDLILHNANIATVDDKFAFAEAMAIQGQAIVAVGKNAEVLALRGEPTKVVDLEGKFVMPGLIDSHVHPSGASLHEFEHPIPDFETIADVLSYVRQRAEKAPAGDWIVLSQVFITRLKEQRYPTKAELDAAAPQNPVMFRTGPDAMLNTLALQASGIDKDFVVTGTGQIEKDARGELTGMLRSCTRYAKPKASGKAPTEAERRDRLQMLFADYNSVGLTTIADRDCSPGTLAQYQFLRDKGNLTLRIAASHSVDASAKLETVQERIGEVARHPLREPSDWLRVVGIKCYLDGGMLTGSAYMRQPWGVSEIYSIRDPDYRGNLFIAPDKLLPIVRTTVEAGLQFTAHSVGDGAVHALLDAYADVNKLTTIRPTRPSITHCNFMSREAIEQMAQLGVVADIQPAWLYLDARTLTAQFGYERLRYFQPLKTIFERGVIAGGGSDHMQKIGSLRSINPYNPFLGMWTTITRRARWYEGQLHPEEALTREQAIRFYTRNNAYITFLDDKVGSLEVGKLADFIILDRDLVTCPVDDIQKTKVLATYVGGKRVYEQKP